MRWELSCTLLLRRLFFWLRILNHITFGRFPLARIVEGRDKSSLIIAANVVERGGSA